MGISQEIFYCCFLLFREVDNRLRATDGIQAKFVIERNRMYVENGNRATQAAQLTPDIIEPNPKNPIIASFFRNIGYADQLGSGVRNLFKYSKIYSGEEPVFDEGDVFRITVPLDESEDNFTQTTQTTQSATQTTQSENSTSSSEIIYRTIAACSTITQREIAEKTGLNINTVKYYIRKMQANGIIERAGTSRNGHWVVK